jgi:molybdopterin-guanine dinucleotide biosynthesis protein A
MLTIVVQAGGESTRMGQDKALIPFLGKPLIQRVFERVAKLADEVLITTNHPESFAFLNTPLIPDLLPGRGALGGLYTALSAASHPIVGVVACDMPFVNTELLKVLQEQLLESGCDAVVPHSPGGMEPFHAIYRREPCLPLVKSSLEAGLRRVDSWFSEARILYLAYEEVLKLDPLQVAFMNVNTPEEFLQAEKLAREESS